MHASDLASEEMPIRMHKDFRVRSAEDLERHRQRAETLGACKFSPCEWVADP